MYVRDDHMYNVCINISITFMYGNYNLNLAREMQGYWVNVIFTILHEIAHVAYSYNN